ncbi:unnamed protein product [Cochlearia groenlandica]
MKRSKKQRVSWPPGPKLCQVKLFRTEDCPAKVASQLPNQSSMKPRAAPDLPPGFEGNQYADKPKVLNIPRIKWKRPPPKFVVKDTWLIGDGGESTETLTENLRISKVLEAVYPHRSAIPTRPSVSPVVEAESYDDSKTPTIRLTPIEDEWESPKESSHTSQESNFTANKQDHSETELLCSIQEPVVSGLAPDMSLVASAAMAAFMKTKEQGSMVDPELLIKFLSDPKMIKNLINDKTGISSETKTNPTIETNINNHTRPVPQHVTASPVATTPQPLITPREHKPFTNPDQRRVSPPKPGYVNVAPINQISRNPLNIPMPANPRASVAPKQPSLPARPPSSSLPMNHNLQRLQHSFAEPMVIVRPQHQQQVPNVQASNGFGIGRFDTYPMNLNRGDATGVPRPVIAQPMKKSLDYFKNLIKEHGTDNHETKHNQSQNGIILNGQDKVKAKRKCVYFNSARGCKLGDSCTFGHDGLVRSSFQGETPMAKRMKFGRYEKQNGFMKTTF